MHQTIWNRWCKGQSVPICCVSDIVRCLLVDLQQQPHPGAVWVQPPSIFEPGCATGDPTNQPLYMCLPSRYIRRQHLPGTQSRGLKTLVPGADQTSPRHPSRVTLLYKQSRGSPWLPWMIICITQLCDHEGLRSGGAVQPRIECKCEVACAAQSSPFSCSTTSLPWAIAAEEESQLLSRLRTWPLWISLKNTRSGKWQRKGYPPVGILRGK